MHIIQHYDIPDNIADYLDTHNGVNLNININPAYVDYGYGHTVWYSVTLSKLTRTCHRCGYDPVWNPNDDKSKCVRHTYDDWRYDEVFVWSPIDNQLSLEEAFDEWLRLQPTSWYEPAKLMISGRLKK
jgi:hypothetical protein